MQNPHELVKKRRKKNEKYPRWYESCIDPWFYFLPDLQFAEKEWIQSRLSRYLRWFDEFFFQFLSSVFAPFEQEAVTIFCEIFSSVLKAVAEFILKSQRFDEWEDSKNLIFFFWENVERHEQCRIKLPTEVLELSVPNTKQRTNLAAP